MTNLSFTDESYVDKIDERNQFPYHICVSHYNNNNNNTFFIYKGLHS